MNAPPRTTRPPRERIRVGGDQGLPFRITLSWCLAAGLGFEVLFLAGGVLTRSRVMTLVDPLVPTLLFLAGAALGFVHGALLGLAGRPPGMTAATSLRGIVIAAFAFLPLSIPAWGAALWISLTPAALAGGEPWFIALAAAAWGACLSAGAWAFLEMIQGMGHVLDRWPPHRLAMVLIGSTFCAFLVVFGWFRPEIWFTEIRPTLLGAVSLAIGATLWLGVPAIVLVLPRPSSTCGPEEAGPVPLEGTPRKGIADGPGRNSRWSRNALGRSDVSPVDSGDGRLM